MSGSKAESEEKAGSKQCPLVQVRPDSAREGSASHCHLAPRKSCDFCFFFFSKFKQTIRYLNFEENLLTTPGIMVGLPLIP